MLTPVLYCTCINNYACHWYCLSCCHGNRRCFHVYRGICERDMKMHKSLSLIRAQLGFEVLSVWMSAHSLTLSVHHVLVVFVCVFVTHTSLLGVILKCPWELISIAYDACFNGPLNGYSIVIHLKYEMAFAIISMRILHRRTDSRMLMCLLN